MRSVTAQVPLTTQFLVQRLRLNNALRPNLAEEHIEEMEEVVKIQGVTDWMILDDDSHYEGQRQLNIFPLPRGSVTTAFESLAYPGYIGESVVRESVWDEGKNRARLDNFVMDHLRASAASMEMEKKEEIPTPGPHRYALSEQALKDLEGLRYSRETLEANAADAPSLGQRPNADADSMSDSNAEIDNQHSVTSEDANSESEASTDTASDAPSENSVNDDEDDSSVSEDRHSPQITMNTSSTAVPNTPAGNDENGPPVFADQRSPETATDAGSDTGFKRGYQLDKVVDEMELCDC